MRIRIFNSIWQQDVEYSVNKFLQETSGKLHEIGYSRNRKMDRGDEHDILVVYTPEEENLPEKVHVPTNDDKIKSLF